jgi:hypothetical protein
MKTRCQHQNLRILEYVTCTSEHFREADGSWWHNNEPGDITNRLDVKCKDCGMNATYWRGSKNNPKWLLKAMAELGWPEGERND